MKLVCYCADDFAMNAEINHAILNLLRQQVLHATSCMTQSPYWFHDAHELLSIDHPIEIGLHLNFTHDFKTKDVIYNLNELIAKAWGRSLDPNKIKESIAHQWQRFIQATGKAPDFVDGHQHVHQFPVIREILLDFLKEQNFKGWVRSLDKPLYIHGYKIKTGLLHLLGAKKFQHLCHKNQIFTNTYFAGVYDFSPNIDYATLNREWLKKAEQKTLIMCHPAIEQVIHHDPIRTARVNEYNYLKSKQFLEDCQTFNVQLNPIGAV